MTQQMKTYRKSEKNTKKSTSTKKCLLCISNNAVISHFIPAKSVLFVTKSRVTKKKNFLFKYCKTKRKQSRKHASKKTEKTVQS